MPNAPPRGTLLGHCGHEMSHPDVALALWRAVVIADAGVGVTAASATPAPVARIAERSRGLVIMLDSVREQHDSPAARAPALRARAGLVPGPRYVEQMAPATVIGEPAQSTVIGVLFV
jgi:hypothetical protein